MSIKSRKSRSRIVQFISPGYSHCHCCGWTWNKVNGKTMKYSENSGCFAICEDCFGELVSERKYDEIINYYTDLLESQRDDSKTDEYIRNVIKSIKSEIGIECIRDYKIDKILY